MGARDILKGKEPDRYKASELDVPLNDTGPTKCIYLGKRLRTELCPSCKGQVRMHVHACDKFGECVLGQKELKGRPACGTCPERVSTIDAGIPLPQPMPIQLPRWTWVSNLMHAQHASELIKYVPSSCQGIVGIARSGLFAATLMATTLNLPLFELSGQNKLRAVGSGSRTNGLTRHNRGPLFVVDDSVYGGHAMNNAKRALRYEGFEFLFAAVYVQPHVKHVVNYYSRLLPSPHLFEWNIFNNGIVHGNASDPVLRGGVGFDIDGVICEECPVSDLDTNAYRMWLKRAMPRSIPRLTDVPVLATGRIELFREETMEWMRRWNVRPRHLEMFQAESNSDPKRTSRAVAEHKAEQVKRHGLSLFIESDEYQARVINQIARKPVVCTSTGKVFV